jgi:hypothetical protein
MVTRGSEVEIANAPAPVRITWRAILDVRSSARGLGHSFARTSRPLRAGRRARLTERHVRIRAHLASMEGEIGGS